jgi:hypothetical protein
MFFAEFFKAFDEQHLRGCPADAIESAIDVATCCNAMI